MESLIWQMRELKWLAYGLSKLLVEPELELKSANSLLTAVSAVPWYSLYCVTVSDLHALSLSYIVLNTLKMANRLKKGRHGSKC
jgi:hypothetical protein